MSRIGTFLLFKQLDRVDGGGGGEFVHVPKLGWQPAAQYASVVPLEEYVRDDQSGGPEETCQKPN